VFFALLFFIIIGHIIGWADYLQNDTKQCNKVWSTTHPHTKTNNEPDILQK